jgi:cell division inhibitor SulA/protein ImuA
LAWCVINELLKDPRIWKAGCLARGRQTLSTGFADLDHALSGGWPVGVLTELLVDLYGMGELRLLMPALKALSKRTRKKVLLVAPPYIPYAPAFVRQGMNVSRLLVADCRRQTDVLWTMEQALRSGTCAAVLAWVEDADERALRRLQLAVEEGAVKEGAVENGAAQGGCWAMLFRPSRFGRHRSPAALRIRLQPGRSRGVRVSIFKNRGGRPRELKLRVPDLDAGI